MRLGQARGGPVQYGEPDHVDLVHASPAHVQPGQGAPMPDLVLQIASGGGLKPDAEEGAEDCHVDLGDGCGWE